MKKLFLILVIAFISLGVFAQRTSNRYKRHLRVDGDSLIVKDGKIFRVVDDFSIGGEYVIEGQTKARGGLTIGDETVSGTNITKIDSVTIFDSKFAFFNGSDTIAPYTPVADQVVIGDVALLKYMEQSTKTGSYELVLTDAAIQIIMNAAGATNLTIPLNSSVAFLLGTQITISCIGAGQTTIVLTGGVTAYSVADNLAIIVKGDATIIKIATDEWKIIGALE